MPPPRAWLPADIFRDVADLDFRDDLENGLASLQFQSALPQALDGLQKTYEAFKPLPIVVSERPSVQPLGSPVPMPQGQPRSSPLATPETPKTPEVPTFRAEDFGSFEQPSIPGPDVSPDSVRSAAGISASPTSPIRSTGEMSADMPLTAGASGYAPSTGRGAEGVEQWSSVVSEAARQYGVPEAVIKGIMEIESGGNPGAVSAAGALGLMQVMPFHYQPGENGLDPRTSILRGAKILADNYRRWGTWDQAAAAYFGAIDDQGRITDATDATGTAGSRYVQLFRGAASKYGPIEGGQTSAAPNAGASPSPAPAPSSSPPAAAQAPTQPAPAAGVPGQIRIRRIAAGPGGGSVGYETTVSQPDLERMAPEERARWEVVDGPVAMKTSDVGQADTGTATMGKLGPEPMPTAPDPTSDARFGGYSQDDIRYPGSMPYDVTDNEGVDRSNDQLYGPPGQFVPGPNDPTRLPEGAMYRQPIGGGPLRRVDDGPTPPPLEESEFPVDIREPGTMPYQRVDAEGVDRSNDSLYPPARPFYADEMEPWQQGQGGTVPGGGLPPGAMYRQPLTTAQNFLPGDGGTPPQTTEQPYDPDQGPRESGYTLPPAPLAGDDPGTQTVKPVNGPPAPAASPYDDDQPWRPTPRLGQPPVDPPIAADVYGGPPRYDSRDADSGRHEAVPYAPPETWYGQAAETALRVIAPALAAYDAANEWLINNPITGALNPQAWGRELGGTDQLYVETREDQLRLESLIRRYRAGDTSVEPEIQALTESLNRRTKGDRASLLAAGQRNPDKGAETLGQAVQAGATIAIAPSVGSGAARNVVAGAMDPLGQGLSAALETPGRIIQAAPGIVRRGSELLEQGRATARRAEALDTGGGAYGTLGISPDEQAMRGLTRPRVVPPEVADTLDFPIRIPDDPATIRAIESIGGTVDPERGVTLNVTRAQGPSAAGGVATRGGVFYEAVPEGGRSSFVTGSDNPNAVGGTQVIPPTPTRFRSPLILSDAPGSSSGFDAAMRQIGPPNVAQFRLRNERTGQLTDAVFASQAEAEQYLDRFIPALRQNLTIVPEEGPPALRTTTARMVDRDIRTAQAAGPEGSPARAQALKDVVSRYGGDPNLIDDLLKIRGADASESAWAIKENILAANARKQGYDGVVTVQRGSTMDPDALHEAAASHPQYQSAKAHVDELEAEMNALTPGTWQWDHARADWEAAASDLESLVDELVASGEVKPPARITELMDPREARNPTPGASREVSLLETATQLDDARKEWRRLAAEMQAGKGDPAALDQAMARVAALEQDYDTVLRTGSQTVHEPSGFTLREDIPRRSDGGTTASASAGALPSTPGSGILPTVNRAASEAIVGGTGGAVIEQARNPDEDPRTAAARGFAMGAVGFPLATRAARGVARRAGAVADSGGARATLGSLPDDAPRYDPRLAQEPTLPGMEPPPRVREALPDVSDERNVGSRPGMNVGARTEMIPGFERIDPLTDPVTMPTGQGIQILPTGTLNTPRAIIENVIRQEQAQAKRLAVQAARKPETAVQPGQAGLPGVAESRPLRETIREAVEPWARRIDIIRYAGMLSDSATQVVNAAGGTLMQGVDIAATPIAAALDAGRSAVTGTPRQVFFSELPAKLAGMRGGAAIGLQNAAEILRTGLSPADAVKQMDREAVGFASGNAKVDFAFEAPLRALAASDAVFRTMAQGGHLASEGMAAAMKAHPGQAITPEMLREAMKNPEVLESAQKLAARTVLQEDRMVTNWYRQAMRYRPKNAVEEAAIVPLRAALSVEIPFVRTPYNIIAQGAGLTPAGLAGVVQDMAEHKPARAIEYRVARVALGTAVMAGAAADYASGNLIGPRPTDPKEASTWPPGQIPWSRKVQAGGQTYYIPLALLGPLAVPSVAAILMAESAKKGGDMTARAGRVALGIGQYAAQNTFFQSVSNIGQLFDARQDQSKTAQRHIEQIVAQYSPHIIGGGALGREIQQIMGMPQRDPEGALEALLATHPLTASKVEPRQDVLGRPSVPNASGPIRAIARVGKANDAGVIRAYRAAKESLPLAAPKQIKDPNTDQMRTLTPKQQHRWRRAFGAGLQEAWNGEGNPTDAASLSSIREDARRVADETILGLR